MLLRMIGYEMKRSVRFYAVWAAAALLLAALARLKIFSLTDMPLFYLMLFGSIGILLFRYHSSMHGAEAALLFTIDLSPRKQMLVRYISAFLWSIVTALMIGAALRLQGENISAILQNLSFPMGLMLLAEVTFSVFTTFIKIGTAWTLSNIRPFSARPAVFFVVITVILFGAESILASITQGMLPAHLVVTQSGEVLISAMNNMPSSISFSMNAFLWNVISTLSIVLCIPAVLRKKLLITG